MANDNLKKAKKAKKDEFYTQLTDIEKELCNYTKHFEGKRILCNCDDPRVSNFLRYFVAQFTFLKLKSVTATCYKNTNPDLFTQNLENRAIRLDYTGQFDYHYTEDFRKIPFTYLKSDGDFRNPEIIEILKQSDVVVTNPPFSLFREYVEQLIKYDKKFLIIGPLNAITYKETFKLIKENKMWLGQSIHSGDREFGVPENYPLDAATYRVDKEGNKFIRIKGVRWFTNLDYSQRHEIFDTGKKIRNFPYKHYENFDAINVDKTSNIPMDYSGVMGVPITFLDKYNPEQFEVVALGIVGSCEFTKNVRMEILDKHGRSTGKFTQNAKGTLYRKFDPKTDKVPTFKDAQTGELYHSIYARILIKRK